MKTAVDWLVDHLYLVIPNEERDFLEGLREEALKKEKEQIVDFGYKCRESKNTLPQDIFNQTYNQN